MKTRTRPIIVALAVLNGFGVLAGASSQLPTTSSGAAGLHAVGNPPVPAFPSVGRLGPKKLLVVLYDQYNNATTTGPLDVTSQDFEAALNSNDDQAADDFAVPVGQTWQISEVDVLGEYNTGPAASFNVFFYTNGAGGLPGTLVYTATGQTFTGTSDFVITLSVPAILTAGTHWVSVQARQDLNPNGQWFWHNRDVQSNAGAAWQNPGDGFGTGCTSWARRTTCVGQTAPDQVFRLVGSIVTSTPIPIPVASSDFDGDGAADKAVFRPATGTWYVKKSNGSGDLAVQWGASGDIPAAGNYAGDARADFAVFRPSNGTWYVRSAEGASQPSVQWGASGDVAVPGHYGGDTRTDFAVWRPSNGTWYVQTAEGTLLPSVQWGTAGDIPVSGDYDGDGVTDLAVFRPSNGTWYVRFSGGGTAAIGWGVSGDIPVAADFTGDGRADYGIYRPSTGTWYVKSSASLTEFPSVAWGASGDVPLPAQMAGDSRADNVVWRPSNGNWYVRSAEGLFPPSVPWGTSGDIPVAH